MTLPVARSRLFPLCLLLLAGCGHTDPFDNPDRSIDGAFQPGEPLRLTYNGGPDLAPRFLPDGSALLYAFARPGDAGGDQCLGLLRPGGGTTLRESCPRDPASLGALDVLGDPAAIDDTSLAYTRERRANRAGEESYFRLVAAPLADPEAVRVLAEFPFRASSGALHLFAAFVAPLRDGTVAYLAQRSASAAPSPLDDPLLVTVGVEAAAVSVGGTGAPQPIAGTDSATSVAPGAEPGDLLFTLPASGTVYVRRASGLIEPLYTFAETARQPTLAGGRLVAVVGGRVEQWLDLGVGEGTVQVDFGGPLVLADLATGEVTPLTPFNEVWERPSLSPDGRFVTAVRVDGVRTGREDRNVYRVALP